MAEAKSLTLRERIFGGKARCSHCRESFDKANGWPTRMGRICPSCRGTWNQIGDLFK